jgi:hypothetical protein
VMRGGAATAGSPDMYNCKQQQIHRLHNAAVGICKL